LQQFPEKQQCNAKWLFGSYPGELLKRFCDNSATPACADSYQAGRIVVALQLYFPRLSTVFVKKIVAQASLLWHWFAVASCAGCGG